MKYEPVFSFRTLCAGLFCISAAVFTLLAGPAFAHGGGDVHGNVWLLWDITPDISLPLFLAGLIYGAGIKARKTSERWANIGRDISFYGGLFAIFLALQSPIEPLSDHVFILHQVEHMFLQTVGPLLIMLAQPQATLMRGSPRWLMRYVVTPIIRQPVIRVIFGILSHPVGATVFFLSAFYFWMIPHYHDLAILNEPIHYSWHFSLMISGLFFFWRIFDPRPHPHGATLGVRLVMFWTVVIGNILLGTYLSFKSGGAIYHAYDINGRLWGIDGATDERFGGLTMWVPGSMMFAVAAFAMIYGWGKRETQNQNRREQRQAYEPVTSEDFVAARRSGNKSLALGLVGFVAVVFIMAVSVATIYDYPIPILK